MDIEISDKFKSKRNNVYKVKVSNNSENEIAIMQNYEANDENIKKERGESKIAIMKKYNFDSMAILEREYTNIKMLQKFGIFIPEIIYKNHDSLFLEYIPGELIGDLVEKQIIGDWIDKFALWMANFHNISSKTGNLLKMDVNLRNFIYSNGQVYGLDFEEIGFGDARIDLGNICFFILTNKPSFTKEKHMIMRRFLKSYEKHSGLKLKEMDKYLLQSKKEAKIRRKQQ